MDVKLSLEKQKEELLKEQVRQAKEKQLSGGSAIVGEHRETESRQTLARKREIKAVMQDFATRCNGEWKEKDVRASISMSMPEIRFAISDFANLTADGNRSGAAVELRNCLLEMRAMTQDQTKEPSAEEYTEKLFELSMASEGYCDSHRGRMWTLQGSARVGIAKKVRGMTRDFLSTLVTGEEEEKIQSNEDADYVTGETLKTVTKDLAKAASAYRTFSARIGRDCQAYTPQELLKRRMQALRINERKIKLYRMNYPEIGKRDPEIQAMIEAYEEGLRWEAVRAFTKQDQKGAYLSEMIEKQVEEEGEIEHRDKLSFADRDEGLDAEQIKGIDAIDNWLIRNFQNGGLAGALIGAVKNEHEDFVSGLLSLTKRERLHMYYLVEMGKRKNAGITDIGASQSSIYVPDLKAFKDQMLATKWKFWTRVTGGYTYMHKLSQAFHKTVIYRKEIQRLAGLKQEEKTQRNKAGTDPAAQVRYDKLIELKGALEEYYRNLKTANQLSGKKRTAEEVRCREMADDCQKRLRELVDLDSALLKANPADAQQEEKSGENIPDTVGTSASMAAAVAGAPSGLVSGVSAGSGLFGGSWHLESAGWAGLNLWTGSIAGSSSGAAGLIGAVTTLIALKEDWNQLSHEERSEIALSAAGAFASVAEGAVSVAGLAETAGSLSESATVSTATKTAGTVVSIAGSAISCGIAIAGSVRAGKMKVHGAGAKEFFDKKRSRLMLRENMNKDLSKEKKRELKYERNMVRLQEDLRKRETKNAAGAWISAGLSVASIFVPGIGAVSAGFALISSIIDSKVVTGIRTRLFDNFFDMDNLVTRAMESRRKNRLLAVSESKSADREIFKESLRKRVAACAGFCDVHEAATDICAKFAGLIRDKLFGGKAESEEEKQGYVEFVRALNLPYDAEQEVPEENTLMRKLSAQ